MNKQKLSGLAKVRLRNVGNGILEITDNALKFYLETGRFRKQRKIAREIPLTAIDSIERLNNDLNVVCEDATYTFAFEQANQAEAIQEKVALDLSELKKVEDLKVVQDKEVASQEKYTIDLIESVESLFTVLKNLHGRVDWKVVETEFSQFEENIEKYWESPTSIELDIKPLAVAIQERRSRESAEQAFAMLKTLYEQVNKTELAIKIKDQNSLYQKDAKLAIHAFYVLNDIALGIVVGDVDMGEEKTELLETLDELAKKPEWQIDTSAVKQFLEKLSDFEAENKSSLFDEFFLLLGQRLKELIIAPSTPATTDSEISKKLAAFFVPISQQ